MQTNYPYRRFHNHRRASRGTVAPEAAVRWTRTDCRLWDILLVSFSVGWSEREETAWRMARALRDADHSCRCIAVLGSPLERRLESDGIEVRAVGKRALNPFALWQLRRYCRQTSPDVLHFLDPEAAARLRWGLLGLHGAIRVVSAGSDDRPRLAGVAAQMDQILCGDSALATMCTQQWGIPAERVSIQAWSQAGRQAASARSPASAGRLVRQWELVYEAGLSVRAQSGSASRAA